MDNVSAGGWDGVGITPYHPLRKGGGNVALLEEEGASHRKP